MSEALHALLPDADRYLFATVVAYALSWTAFTLACGLVGGWVWGRR